MNCIKYLMFFFNFLFWLSGLILIIIGAIVRDKYGDYFSFVDNKFANAPMLIIVVGVIVFIIGFLGCCGAVKENYCMVTTFAVLLALIFILEIVAGALGISYKSKVNVEVEKRLQLAVNEYRTSKGAKDLLDWAQETMNCCGYAGPADYVNGTCPGAGNAVASCHVDNDCKKDLRDTKKGCKDAFIAFVKSNMALVGGVAIGIAFIQLLGIIFACLLMRAIKGEYEVV